MVNEMQSKARCEVPWDSGFYFIPGFTKYAINKEGVLKNIATGKLISWVVTRGGGPKNITGGYYITNIYNDSGLRSGVSRHRLLAIMFIPCPGEFKDYTVNHDDGVPGNDILSNLVWATSSQNNQHAYDTGLRPNGTVPVILRYWKTGMEIRYASLAECARALNKSHASLSTRLRRNPGVAYSDGLQLKVEGVCQWVSTTDRIAQVRETYTCVAKCTKTGKLIICDSASAMGVSLGLNPDKISKAILTSSDEPYNGYLFRLYVPGHTWEQL